MKDGFIKLVLGCVIWVLASFVIMETWSMFIVPLGVVSIGMAHAAGISLLHKIIKGCSQYVTLEKKDFTIKNYVDTILMYGVVYAIAHLIHSFM